MQRGDQGKFFKTRAKSSPRLKGPKALWRKWHYPLISMALKCKDWTKLSRKERLQNTRIAKLWEFCKVTENLHFLKKCKGGTNGNFSKIAQKNPRLKGLNVLWRKWHYPLYSILLKSKDWARFWRKKRLKECPNCQVMAIFAWSPKTRIF